MLSILKRISRCPAGYVAVAQRVLLVAVAVAGLNAIILVSRAPTAQAACNPAIQSCPNQSTQTSTCPPNTSCQNPATQTQTQATNCPPNTSCQNPSIQTSSPPTACSVGSFFGIPPWYKYLATAQPPLMVFNTTINACALDRDKVNEPSHWVQVILLVALAALDIALRIAGFVAVAFVFYGGVRYVTSHGEPEKTKEAQESIINAIIGLAIALVATAAVAFIANRIGQ